MQQARHRPAQIEVTQQDQRSRQPHESTPEVVDLALRMALPGCPSAVAHGAPHHPARPSDGMEPVDAEVCAHDGERPRRRVDLGCERHARLVYAELEPAPHPWGSGRQEDGLPAQDGEPGQQRDAVARRVGPLGAAGPASDAWVAERAGKRRLEAVVHRAHRVRAELGLVHSPGPRLPHVYLLQPDDVGVEGCDGGCQPVVVYSVVAPGGAVRTESVLDVERGDAHVLILGPRGGERYPPRGWRDRTRPWQSCNL